VLNKLKTFNFNKRIREIFTSFYQVKHASVVLTEDIAISYVKCVVDASIVVNHEKCFTEVNVSCFYVKVVAFTITSANLIC